MALKANRRTQPSPLFMQMCSAGKTLPKAKLEFMRADSDGKPVKYYEVELENVLIGSITQSVHEGGLMHEMKTLSLLLTLILPRPSRSRLNTRFIRVVLGMSRRRQKPNASSPLRSPDREPEISLIPCTRMPRGCRAAARKANGCAGRGMSGVRTRPRMGTGASSDSIYGLERALLGGVAEALLAILALSSLRQNKKASRGKPFCFVLAERVGFEPTVRSPVRLISSQVHSTTLPPLLVTGRCIRERPHYSSPK